MSTLIMSSSPTEQPVPRTESDLQSLPTERLNEASEGLDTKSAIEIARIINHEDAKVAAAVKRRQRKIAMRRRCKVVVFMEGFLDQDDTRVVWIARRVLAWFPDYGRCTT